MIAKELRMSLKVVWGAIWEFYERVIAPGVTSNILMGVIVVLAGLLLLALSDWVIGITMPPTQS